MTQFVQFFPADANDLVPRQPQSDEQWLDTIRQEREYTAGWKEGMATPTTLGEVFMALPRGHPSLTVWHNAGLRDALHKRGFRAGAPS